MILGITSIGRVIVYLIVISMLKHVKEKDGHVPINLIYPTHRPIQFTNTEIKFTSMDRRSYHFPEYHFNTIFYCLDLFNDNKELF